MDHSQTSFDGLIQNRGFKFSYHDYIAMIADAKSTKYQITELQATHKLF